MKGEHKRERPKAHSSETPRSGAIGGMDAAERKANRERVGERVIAEYLSSTPADDQETRERKERWSKEGLLEVMSDIIDSKDPEAVKEALDELGISQSQTKKRDGKFIEQWRLQNPDPEVVGIPGSFAKEEHLKAFIVGFTEASNLHEKMKVVRDVYEYIGLEPPPLPAAVEIRKFEEMPAPKERMPRIPLSSWSRALGKAGRSATLAIGLILALSGQRGHMSERGQEGRSGDTQEMIAEKPKAETPPPPKETGLDEIREGRTVSEICRDILGPHAKDHKILTETIKQALRENDIGDDVYKVQGRFDSRKLRVGTVVDVSSALKKRAELDKLDDIKGGIAMIR